MDKVSEFLTLILTRVIRHDCNRVSLTYEHGYSSFMLLGLPSQLQLSLAVRSMNDPWFPKQQMRPTEFDQLVRRVHDFDRLDLMLVRSDEQLSEQCRALLKLAGIPLESLSLE